MAWSVHFPFLFIEFEKMNLKTIYSFHCKVLNDTKQGSRPSNIDFSIKLNMNLVETIKEVPNT